MKRFAYLSLFIFGALLSACASSQQHEAVEAARSRSQTAEAMFQEHCKSAGEKIYKTVDNVEGVFLLKLRPKEPNFSNQFALTDPYGRDLGGDGYMMSFLRGYNKQLDPPLPGAPPRVGYYYVEAIDPKDRERYRYTGSMKVVGRKDSTAPNIKLELQRNPNFDLNNYAFTLDKQPSPGPAPRYGVTYDDLSTRQDREYWIAGSSLKVIDLQTNEVIAERIGYMMDRGQGSSGTGGGRSPWLLAADHACPGFQRNPFRPIQPGHGANAQTIQTLDFVEKILKPIPSGSQQKN